MHDDVYLAGKAIHQAEHEGVIAQLGSAAAVSPFTSARLGIPVSSARTIT